MSRIGFLFLASLLGAMPVVGDSAVETGAPLFELDDFNVVATGREVASFELPQSVVVISRSEILTRSPRTMADLFEGMPGVLVQRTAYGQASPYLRGFTGYQTLLLIDGIRVNNSVFRSGPNQYWATIDPLAIERLELARGPASVLYGSDAVGGAVNVVSLQPAPGEDLGGAAFVRLASAERSATGRLEGEGKLGEAAAWHAGFTARDFGDVRGGGDVGRQPGTGYSEWGFDAKMRLENATGGRWTAALNVFSQDDVPRTHSTVDGIRWEGTVPGSDLQRNLDQRRALGYVQYEDDGGGGLADAFKLSLSWHQQKESEDRIRGNGRRQYQGFEVNTLGLLGSAMLENTAGTWDLGFDYYRDDVSSFRLDYPAKGGEPQRRIQGPVGDDATYDLAGAYLRWQAPLPDPWELIAAGRLAYARADVGRYQDPVSGDPASLTRSWVSPVFSLQGLYRLNPQTHLYGSVAQSYRAPNLSDLTRFDAARSDEIETPSTEIDPEEFVTAEIGIKTAHERFLLEAAYFYTDIRSQIMRTPTGRVIEGRREVTKLDSGSGYVHGVELTSRFMFSPEWELFAQCSWLEGRIDTFPDEGAERIREPISRMMPANASAGVVYRPSPPLEVRLRATVADEQDLLNTRDAADTQRFPPGGTPGYTLLDFSVTWRPSGNLQLIAGVENLTDEDYRTHGSGSNGPGRNWVATARLWF